MTTPQPEPYSHPSQPAPRRSRRGQWIVGTILTVAAATAAVTAIAGGFSASNPPTPVVAKTFAVYGTVTLKCGTDCLSYMDINNGAQVEVVDGSSHVLAVGYLTPSTNTWSGTYTFTVQGVPRGRNVYGVHVGNVNRGVVWEQESQAATDGFALSIG